jgi:hypothetical protein
LKIRGESSRRGNYKKGPPITDTSLEGLCVFSSSLSGEKISPLIFLLKSMFSLPLDRSPFLETGLNCLSALGREAIGLAYFRPDLNLHYI